MRIERIQLVQLVQPVEFVPRHDRLLYISPFRKVAAGHPGFNLRGKKLESGVLKNSAEPKLDAERFFQARGYPRRQQRMTSELKEVIIQTGLLDFQNVGPDSGYRRLDQRSRPALSVRASILRIG